MASKRNKSSEIPVVQERKRRHQDTKQNTDGNDMNVPCMCTCMCSNIDYSRIESIIRRVVKEEIPQAHGQSPSLMPNECGGISELAKPYELRFINETKETYFTHRKILSESDDAIQIALYDVGSNCIVKDGALSCIKIEICAVDGDFGSENNVNWSSEEFNSNILRPREGKKAILKGNHTIITLNGGIGFISKLEFTDNSRWVRTGTFRLAAKSKELPNIREAITKPIIVKDKRGEACKKRPQPLLNDEVWRLRNIGKGGNLDKQLCEAGIETVKDLMRLYTMNPSSLKEKFGDNSRYKWEDIIEHAKDYVIDDNEHYIYNATHTQTSLLFNSIYEVEKVSFHAQNYRSPQTFNSDEKKLVELVKQEAYKNEKHFIPIELKELAINPQVQVQVQVEDFSGTSSTPADHPEFDLSSAVLEGKFDWEFPLSPLITTSWEQSNAFHLQEFNYPPSQFLLNSDVPTPANATRTTAWNKLFVVLKWFILRRVLSRRPT